MRDLKFWGAGVLFGIVLMLIFKTCKEPCTVTQITIPEQAGTFKPEGPKYIYTKDTVHVNKWIVNNDTTNIYTKNPVNDSIATAYINALSDIERYKMLLDAIQIRQFKNTFEDSSIVINVSGEVQGLLNSIQSDYIIKERKVDVPQVKDRFKILIGAQIKNSFKLNDFSYDINLGVQDQKNRIYKVGYSKLNGNNYLSIGYDLPLYVYRR